MKNKVLICPIRKKEVKATPEESVRASFLTFLLQKGFPSTSILVEYSLKALPHLLEKITLDRRVDILCYNTRLEPLLLVECKEQIQDTDMIQLLSYNHFVKAKFAALISLEGLIIRTQEGDQLPFTHFPIYQEWTSFNP